VPLDGVEVHGALRKSHFERATSKELLPGRLHMSSSVFTAAALPFPFVSSELLPRVFLAILITLSEDVR